MQSVFDTVLEVLNKPFVPHLLVLAFISFSIYRSAVTIGENERFAVFWFGRFAGFKGPGLYFNSFANTYVRLPIGAVGRVTNAELVNFGGVDVPIRTDSSFRTGDTVAVDGFDDEGPRLVPSASRPTSRSPC